MTYNETKKIRITNNYPKLLGTKNTKIDKSNKSQSPYYTHILYLAPHNLADRRSVCPFASQGCKSACLYTAGREAFTQTQNARIKRTEFFWNHRQAFIQTLTEEIETARRRAKRTNKKLAIRLNGTSDIAFERIAPRIFTKFHDVTFYDYTKSKNRMSEFLAFPTSQFPKNYHLTFSRSESNQHQVENILEDGGNVSVVFRNTLPATYHGKKVINGDKTDERFLDPENVVVGLLAKGQAKKDVSGFIVSLNEERIES